MAVVLDERHETLRLGGVGGTVRVDGAAGTEPAFIRRKPGVVDFEDIPVGAIVHARVHRIHGLLDKGDQLAPVQVVSAGGRTLTFVDADPDTITASTGSFIADGYRPGMRVIVAGTGSNNGTFLIMAVSALVLILDPVETLAAEGPLSGGETLDGTPTLAQPYRFELAPFPDLPTSPAAVAGARSLKRIIIVPSAAAGAGSEVVQVTPTFAAFSPVQRGALIQAGKSVHSLPMPGGALEPRDRNILRFRWTGTEESAEILGNPAGGTTLENTIWAPANPHVNLAPGSIRITLPSSGLLIRDDGKGRLVSESGQAGPAGDGVVDYVTGAFKLRFDNAETGNVLADYERDCPYEALNVDLSWDVQMAQ